VNSPCGCVRATAGTIGPLRLKKVGDPDLVCVESEGNGGRRSQADLTVGRPLWPPREEHFPDTWIGDVKRSLNPCALMISGRWHSRQRPKKRTPRLYLRSYGFLTGPSSSQATAVSSQSPPLRRTARMLRKDSRRPLHHLWFRPGCSFVYLLSDSIEPSPLIYYH
jgi:hypothetical protein